MKSQKKHLETLEARTLLASAIDCTDTANANHSACFSQEHNDIPKTDCLEVCKDETDAQTKLTCVENCVDAKYTKIDGLNSRVIQATENINTETNNINNANPEDLLGKFKSQHAENEATLKRIQQEEQARVDEALKETNQLAADINEAVKTDIEKTRTAINNLSLAEINKERAHQAALEKAHEYLIKHNAEYQAAKQKLADLEAANEKLRLEANALEEINVRLKGRLDKITGKSAKH